MKLYVLPYLAVYDTCNESLGNSELARQGRLAIGFPRQYVRSIALWIKSFSNLNNLLFGKLRKLMLLSMRHASWMQRRTVYPSVFLHAVDHIPGLIRSEKMNWPEARRVVAVVANQNFRSDATMDQLPSFTMHSSLRFRSIGFFGVDHSVSVLESCALPYQARVGAPGKRDVIIERKNGLTKKCDIIDRIAMGHSMSLAYTHSPMEQYV